MERKLIGFRNEMFDNPPADIFYVYVYEQAFFREHSDITFTQNIPENLDPDKSSLVEPLETKRNIRVFGWSFTSLEF